LCVDRAFQQAAIDSAIIGGVRFIGQSTRPHIGRLFRKAVKVLLQSSGDDRLPLRIWPKQHKQRRTYKISGHQDVAQRAIKCGAGG
jgi:hypothetical protein